MLRLGVVSILMLAAWGGDAHAVESSWDSAAGDQKLDLFEALRLVNPKGANAKERLLDVGHRNGGVTQGLKRYEEAARTDRYFDSISSFEGGALSRLTNGAGSGEVQSYLLSALSQGGPLEIVNSYFLSLFLGEQGFSGESQFFLKKAEFLKQIAIDVKDTVSVRPLEYRFPTSYERLGFPLFSPEQLRVVRFPTEKNADLAAYASEQGVDSGRIHARAATLFRYDTNVPRFLFSEYTSPSDLRPAGTAQALLAGVGAQTSASRRLSAGVDVHSVYNRHTRDDIGVFDAWTSAAGIWGSFWNVKSQEVRLRYDYVHLLRDRNALKFAAQTHGPQVAWVGLWNHRYQTEAGYSLQRSFLPTDLPTGNEQLGGTRHVGWLKLAYPDSRAGVQPFLGYQVDLAAIDGLVTRSRTHSLEAGTSYTYKGSLTLQLATSYSFVSYYDDPAQRSDQLKRIRLGGAYRVRKQLALMLDAQFIDNDSNQTERFSFQRWNLVLGPVFALGL